MEVERPVRRAAFYALAPGGWRDYVTLLHPPYTAWHLSYVVIGAALSGSLDGGRLTAALVAFALAVGVAAHCLDELHDRPLGTRVPSTVLVVLAAVALAGAVAIGLIGASIVGWGLLPWVVGGVLLVLAYDLEWGGRAIHNELGFALGILARPLTRTPDVTESAPAWSPTGHRIAYTAAPASVPPGRLTSIWTIRIDGREARNLTAATGTAATEDARPDWSPDGSRILFDTNRGLSQTVDGLEVWVMGADGTSPSVVVTSSGRTGELSAVYSPDGRQVADQGCGFGMCLMGLDVLGADGAPAAPDFQIGGDPTDDDVELTNPSWQPVGFRVRPPSVVRPVARW